MSNTSFVGLDIDDLCGSSCISLVSSLVLEDLAALNEASLIVLASVDEIGIVKCELDGAVHNVISCLNTEHKGVVLITNLVAPAAEASTGVDIFGLELGEEFLQNTLALKRRSWVTVVKAAVVSRNNLVLGLDHFSVDETLDGFLEEVIVVDWLHGGF